MPFSDMKPSDIFKCRQCGDCCKGYGGTFVTDKEIDSIALYINVDPESFIEKYCQMSGKRPVLSQVDGGYCIFWDKKCKIHPVKPYMCKAWPFLKSVLVDINNWEIMGTLCPGIRTDIPDNVVEKCVQEKLVKMENKRP